MAVEVLSGETLMVQKKKEELKDSMTERYQEKHLDQSEKMRVQI